MITTVLLDTPGATVAYDIHAPTTGDDGRPPLFLAAAPMDASGFATLASLLGDRTLITFDNRGIGRSTRLDGRQDHTPEQNAEDMHSVIEALGAGPVEMFASSGGAVSALALVAAHPGDVSTLIAHEPPLLALLPDAEQAFAAERAGQETYQAEGWGAGMAAFVALTSWEGPFTDEFTRQEAQDPAALGLPTQDDGSRDDPLLSGSSNAITAYEPDLEALAAAPTRIVIAVGVETGDRITARTAHAVAEALGQEAVVFPSNHGGFLGGEFGQAGAPEEFAARLRDVLVSE